MAIVPNPCLTSCLGVDDTTELAGVILDPDGAVECGPAGLRLDLNSACLTQTADGLGLTVDPNGAVECGPAGLRLDLNSACLTQTAAGLGLTVGPGITCGPAGLTRTCDPIGASGTGAIVGVAVPPIGATQTLVATTPVAGVTAPAARVCPELFGVRVGYGIDLPHQANTRFQATLQVSINLGPWTTILQQSSLLFTQTGTITDNTLTWDSMIQTVQLAPGATRTMQARMLLQRVAGATTSGAGSISLGVSMWPTN